MTALILHRPTGRLLLLVLLETALIMAALVVAAYLRFGRSTWGLIANGSGAAKLLVVALTCQLCAYYADLYNLRLTADRRMLFVRMVWALGAASFILAAIYFWVPWLVIGRGVFGLASGLVLAVVVGWHITFEWASRHVRPIERLLLIGTSRVAVALARELHEMRQQIGVEIVGFIDPDPAKVGTPLINPGVIGTLEDIPSIVRARGVDRVVVSLADARGNLPVEKLLDMKLDGMTFDHLASVYEEYTGKIAVENLRPSWLIFSSGFHKHRLVSTTKRAIDIVGSLIGLIAALPLLALVAVAVKVTSPGPVLYHQKRVGQQGRVFVLHKFRSMVANAEASTGPVWASRDGDIRVTSLGRWLRRTRFDELPQLWNIFVGDMSFVGPRPERPEFVATLTRQLPFYGYRHLVRPGLTGWAQVRYTYGASVEDALQKLQYDLFYIKNLSPALDLFIVLATIKTVVLRKGA